MASFIKDFENIVLYQYINVINIILCSFYLSTGDYLQSPLEKSQPNFNSTMTFYFKSPDHLVIYFYTLMKTVGKIDSKIDLFKMV